MVRLDPELYWSKWVKFWTNELSNEAQWDYYLKTYLMQKNISPIVIFILIIIWVVLDAFTKIWVQIYLSSETISIIPWLLSIEYVRNPGIAFSLPLTWNLLKIVTLILIFVIIIYYIKEERPKKNPLLDIWFAAIFSGALWNAWERIFLSSVTDMIAVERFAVFNLADSLICIWACILLYVTFFTKNTKN